MTGDGIDEGGDAERVDAVGDEFGPLRHGAGDDGGRGGTENRLENEIGEERDPCGEDGRIVALDHGVQPAHQRAAAGKHQTEAQKPVGGRSDGEVHQVLHQDVAGVFGPGEAGLTHGKARLHRKDECRTQQDPNGVDR